jgi:integrase
VQQKGYEGSTVNPAVCALRLFYRDHLGRRDWTCWSQIRIRRHAPLPVVRSRGEVKQLIGAVREARFQVAFALMYHCGLRLNELCHLRVSDLDAARGMLRVIGGKGGKNRQVPVSPGMFAVLRGWWRQHRNKVWLFDSVAASRLPHPCAPLRGCSFLAVCLSPRRGLRLPAWAGRGRKNMAARPRPCAKRHNP